MTRFAAVVVAALCGLAVLASPTRYEIDGLSMAPGLMPGDVVTTGPFRAADRFRRPRRFERWMLTAPDGTPAIKRVVGLPGEILSIRDGDLAIAGRVVLAPPALLAETAVAVPEARIATSAAETPDGGWQRNVSLPVVYDDAAFAPSERRLLLPVRDVGLAAVIGLPGSPADGEAVQVRCRIDDAVVAWNFHDGGRFALVAGRLDGHLVAVAWPLASAIRWAAESRSAVPPDPPAAWDLIRPWPQAGPADTDDAAVVLGLRLDRGGAPLGDDEAGTVIERLAAWRDLFWRPAADGRDGWRLGPDEFFVLGDFPSGSRDSRHWGPLGRAAIHHPVVPLFEILGSAPARGPTPASGASGRPRGER